MIKKYLFKKWWNFVSFTLFLFMCFALNGNAQIIIDGHPTDWAALEADPIPTYFHAQDAFGSGVVDNQFEASKDIIPAADWTWTEGQTKAKNDIANGASVLIDGVLYFAGDRLSNNGDAQIGFWFFIDGTAPQPLDGKKGAFDPHHAIGDLLVLSDFTGGGKNGAVTVLRWVGTGGNAPGDTHFDLVTDIAAVVAQNNEFNWPVPTGWNYIGTMYDYNTFYEGSIDLRNLIGGDIQVCFSSFLLETRSSQSLTASLDDFVASPFTTKPVCSIDSFENVSFPGATDGWAKVSVTGGTPPFQYAWTTSDGSIGSGQGSATIEGLSAGTYMVTITDELGCESTTCEITLETKVTAPTCAVEVTPVTCFDGSDGSATVISNPADDGSYTYLWSNGDTTSTITGLTAGVYTVEVWNGIDPNAGFCDGEVLQPDLVPIVLLCSADLEEQSCQTQDVINSSFSTWISGFSATGGTEPLVITYTVNNVEVANLENVLAPDACGGEVIVQINVEDACGLTASCSNTFNVVADIEVPVIVAEMADGDLGCNPIVEAPTFTAMDNCDGDVTGMIEVTTAGPQLTSGDAECMLYSQTWTANVSDDCENDALPVSTTYTWKQDLVLPVIVAEMADGDLGCNPIVEAPTFTAMDNCDGDVTGMIEVTTAGPQLTSGDAECTLYSQTWTANVSDLCENDALPVSTTYTWKQDLVLPVIVAEMADGDLGCNPVVEAPTFTAMDNCDGDVTGMIEVTTAGPQLTSGDAECTLYSQTWTANVSDDCENDALPVSTTYTWKQDLVLPVIVATDYAICEEELPVTIWADWTDNCSAGGSIESAPGVLFSATECDTTYSYTFLVMDDCENSTEKTVYVTRETQKYGDCETAFGKLIGEDAADATCFLDIPEIKNNRWGWTNKITEAGTYTMALYAGAAKCEVDKGAEVGSVTVTYADGNVTVEYQLSEAYSLSEAHVYVGCTPYPVVKQGKKTTPTVAPGQYTYNAGNLDHLTDLTVSFSGVGEDGFYIIVHGVACEMICACSNSESVSSFVEPEPIALTLDCNLKSGEIVSGVSTYERNELKVYPNPFSEKVTFEFISGVNANAVLEIHNILGQKIITLLDQPVESGVLNRVDYKPVHTVSGIYIYKLTIDGKMQIGRIIYKNE